MDLPEMGAKGYSNETEQMIVNFADQISDVANDIIMRNVDENAPAAFDAWGGVHMLYLIKAKFFGSKQLYTYYSPAPVEPHNNAIVEAPNGELKVVKVMACTPSTVNEIKRAKYRVKPISGVMIEVNPAALIKKTKTRCEEGPI